MKKNRKAQVRRIGCVKEYYEELSAVSGFTQLQAYVQHGSTSRLLHSVAVAYCSYRMALLTGLRFHVTEMVRGALLHDYFLYDTQDGGPARKGHWAHHPAVAAENAGREIELTKIEADIILRHMFPLTVQPPGCRESVMVSLMDKACSVYEFFKRKEPYPRIRREILGEA